MEKRILYPKNLCKLTSFRISEDLRNQSEKAAETLGMTFSQFVRLSLVRNIYMAHDIERQVVERNNRSNRGISFERLT